MTEKASDWQPWSLISQLYPATATVFAFLLFLYLALRVLIGGRRRRQAPEAGGAWPLIGHLRLLGGPKLPHEALGELADKYGPIFTIRLGVHRALVVSNWEMAKECFTANDIAFSNRPKSIALEHMAYNHAMFGFAPYGPYWREVRKIITLELLSTRRLAMLGHVFDSEVKDSIKGIYELWVDKKTTSSNKVFVEMKRWFGDITVNMIFRIMVRKRITEEDTLEAEKTRKAFRDFFELMGVFTVADAIPWLRWLDLGGYEKAMKKTAKELDGVLRGWLEEHKQKRISGEASCELDFMDVMLSVVDDVARQTPNLDADRITKATCLVRVRHFDSLTN